MIDSLMIQHTGASWSHGWPTYSTHNTWAVPRSHGSVGRDHGPGNRDYAEPWRHRCGFFLTLYVLPWIICHDLVSVPEASQAKYDKPKGQNLLVCWHRDTIFLSTLVDSADIKDMIEILSIGQEKTPFRWDPGFTPPPLQFTSVEIWEQGWLAGHLLGQSGAPAADWYTICACVILTCL